MYMHIDKTWQNVMPLKVYDLISVKISSILYDVIYFAISDQNTEPGLYLHIFSSV